MSFNIVRAGTISFYMFFVMYSIYLQVFDFFSYKYPFLLLGTILVYGSLHYLALPMPQEDDVKEVFGESHERVNSSPPPPPLGSPRLNGLQKGQYKMEVIGHRGCGLDCIENSISALRLAKSRGCSAVEFDIMMTKDGVPVLFHDDSTLRMTNVDKLVCEMTFEELRKMDISVMHPLGERWRNETVPTMDEAIKSCLDMDLRFIIDVKDGSPEMVNSILEAYQKYPMMYKRAIVSSFNPKIIYDVRKANPRVIGSMAWRPGYYRYSTWTGHLDNLEHRNNIFYLDYLALIRDIVNDWLFPNVYWWFLGLSTVLLNKDAITKVSLSQWGSKGIKVFPWTVNNPVEKLHLSSNYGVGYLTDTLDGDTKTSGSP